MNSVTSHPFNDLPCFLESRQSRSFRRSIKEGILASLNGDFDDKKLARK